VSPLAPLATIARRFGVLVEERARGILSVERRRHRRLLCVVEGRLRLVASNVVEEQLDAWLVAAGALPEAERKRMGDLVARGGTTLGELLAERERVLPFGLAALVERRTRELALDTLSWVPDAAEFRAGTPRLDHEPTADLHGADLLLDHARRHPIGIEDVRVGIGPPDALMIAAEDAAEVLAALDAPGLAHRVVELCDGTRRAREVAADAGDEEPALRALLGLVLAGLVASGARPGRARVASSAPATRDEIEARLAALERADHYAVLGVAAEAPPQEIRSAYYFLARRYHPDRFRSGLLQDLLPRIEAYFARVTEAQNTLSDPELRRAYDEERAAGLASGEAKQDTASLARQNHARARLAIDKKQYTDAVRFLENAIQLDPRRSIYHLELGRVLALNPRRREEAEAVLRRAAEIDPSHADVYVALGDLLRRLGRDAEATAQYEEALRWDPDHADASERLGKTDGADDAGRGLFGGRRRA